MRLFSRIRSIVLLILLLAGSSPISKGQEPNGRKSPKVLGRAPTFVLKDQKGVSFGSDDLSGQAWIANFMFTRCPTTCPVQTAKLKTVQEQLPKDGKAGPIHIVSFTVDPEHDTPAVLDKYATTAGADGKVWKFLTGPVEALRGAISRDGFKLAVEIDKENPGNIQHSPFFVLVDAYMRIRGLYDSGSEDAVKMLMADIGALNAEIVDFPADIRNPAWMEPRRQAQLKTADSINAFHDFSFKDERRSSGITFRHKIVDDAGRDFKSVHYDHGTGIVVADIDGDDLLDLFFVNQVGRHGLWRNLGNGKFEDITEKAGVGLGDRIGVSASFGDIDNDGDPDLFVTSIRRGNVLFENLGNGTFKNISASSGIRTRGHSSGAVFFDYDRDGLLDLFVTNVGKYTTDEIAKVTAESIRDEKDGGHEYQVGFKDAFAGHLKPDRFEQSRLYRNLGNRTFKDVSKEVSLEDMSWSGDATPVDLNEDGWMDLYVLNMQGDDQIYLNEEGVKFKRVSREWFPKTPWGAMGIKAFDFENDGDLDIFITDMHSDMSVEVGPDNEKAKADMQWTSTFLNTDGGIFGNAFFRKRGDGSFQEVSDAMGAENYWPWGLSVDDLNADGFDDAFIASSMNFPFRYGVNSVLLNDGGKAFRDCEFILGVEPRAGGLAAPWFELNLSGADESSAMVERIKEFGLYPKTEPERIVVWSALGTRSSVIFDLDNDGDLDIVTNEMNHHPMVLLSDLSEKKPGFSYLKVKLVGTKSNRSAFGAVVRVEAGDHQLMKVKDGQSGYLSHSDFPLYFGLDGAKKVDRVEVTWPSGKKQVIEGPIEAKRLLTIKEKA